jgi:lipopolysaccharide/colanic/teichoic acid biosynthesis glycosyltransferase
VKRRRYQHFFKRLIDIILSLTAILILLPFWIPVCLILLLTGEHEVFYFQKRIGYKNKPFFIWKHATMMKASETMKAVCLLHATTRVCCRLEGFCAKPKSMSCRSL